MNWNTCLILDLILCALSLKCAHAGNIPDLLIDELVQIPTIALTKLDVNDSSLKLSYKFKNNTGHDIWICDDLNIYTPYDFEMYMAEDEQSLLIRRRFDVPTDFQWTFPPYCRYVLLRSGQERTESLSIDIPVDPQRAFTSKLATSDRASRLVLEIGFYNEDLPKLIRDILVMAEKLNFTRLDSREHETALFQSYFKGIFVSLVLGGLSRFDEHVYKEGNEEIVIPYTWQALSGEQVLQIEIDGIDIPYEEDPYAQSFASARPANGGKGRACFPAETPVWVKGMILPISRIVDGKAIQMSLRTTPRTCPAIVEKVQEHTGTFECRDIVLESGNHISVVGNHCFMLFSGQWIAAQDLKSGMRLRTHNGTIAIKSITKRATPYTGKVYNLKVRNSDMYMVGKDGVIVRDF